MARLVGGVDEAGRGPWAGPVVAACVIIPNNVHVPLLKESKSVSQHAREKLYEEIKRKTIWGIGMASNKEIDEVNIVRATEMAIRRAIENMPQKPDFLLIDGKDKFYLPIKYKTIIKGDKKIDAIAAASILAKVWRDRLMILFSDMYPQYGFEKHKAYGTKLHRQMLTKFGVSPIHRLSFKPVFFVKKNEDNILLHVCCGPCATSVVEKLKEKFNEITLFFYNPNIHPKKEYERRLDEVRKLAEKWKSKLIEGKYDIRRWFKMTYIYKHEPEKGKRCTLCYAMRMLEAAKLARELHLPYFTTTLTVSPLKDEKRIFHIGKILSEKFGVKFLEEDFKKKNGFKRSVEISKKLNIYRQNYCGCIYSLMERKHGYCKGTLKERSLF